MNATFALQPIRCANVGHAHMHVHALDGLATGWSQLDALLPSGGWPAGALTEVLHKIEPMNAFNLLLPALTTLTQSAKHVVLIEPPTLPLAQTLRQHGIRMEFLHVIKNEAQAGGWNAEQYLSSGCAAAVILWPHPSDGQRLRSLQQSAETGASHAFVFRNVAQARHASSAVLRVMIGDDERGFALNVLRCHSVHHPSSLVLPTTQYY